MHKALILTLYLLWQRDGVDNMEENSHVTSIIQVCWLLLSKTYRRLKILPTLQSAYRKNHSTETAVLKVINDVLCAADRGEVTLLCMLDLSCAFDTVDHGILLDRLRCAFGVQGVAISWTESFYRIGHSQFISPTNSRLQ